MKSTYAAGKTVLASSVFLGMAFGTAHAEICYRLTPFVDVLRLSETKFLDPAVGGSHTLVVGSQIAPGYQLPLVGSLELNTGSTTVLHLGAHAVNATASFGDHVDCILDGIPGGAENIYCDGKVAGRFTGSPPATLTPISCVGLPAAGIAEPGKAQGGP
jgi:hypothetical protein